LDAGGGSITPQHRSGHYHPAILRTHQRRTLSNGLASVADLGDESSCADKAGTPPRLRAKGGALLEFGGAFEYRLQFGSIWTSWRNALELSATMSW